MKKVIIPVDKIKYHNGRLILPTYGAESSGGGGGGGDGVGIDSITTVESPDDGGNNVVTIHLSDGTQSSFNVKNGHKGPAGTTDYNNLDNKPTIPTNTNQLTNGAGYITSAQVPSNYPLQTQTALTVQIAPNTFNVWENAISNDLTITLGTEVSGVMNEYLMQFSIATGSTPQVTFPSNLQWTGIDTFQGGKTYQVSIVNGYAIGVEFDTITT